MRTKTKDFAMLNCKLDKKISDRLEKYCDDTRLSKTATVERALEEYLNKYAGKKQIISDA